jgi:hypothetical protein
MSGYNRVASRAKIVADQLTDVWVILDNRNFQLSLN